MKQVLFLIFIVLVSVAFAQSDPNNQYDDQENPYDNNQESSYDNNQENPYGGDQVTCDQSQYSGEFCPDIYDPVCIPDAKECITTPCFQTKDVSNSCEACTNGADSYTPEKCKYTCKSENLPPGYDSPQYDSDSNDFVVCAYYQKDCDDSSCRNTFERATIACQDPSVLYFTLDACPGKEAYPDGYVQEEECYYEVEENVESYPPNDYDIAISCPNEIYEACTKEYDPVCPAECAEGTDCRKTAGNACEACSHRNVLSYTPGPCEVERVKCDSSSQYDFCTTEYDPVCAYQSDCTEEPCGKTAGNACEACNSGANYYIDGECGNYN